jgi:hypothetical protein
MRKILKIYILMIFFESTSGEWISLLFLYTPMHLENSRLAVSTGNKKVLEKRVPPYFYFCML